MKAVNFESGRVGHNIVQSAIPLLVAQLFSLLYNIVDRIFIGRIEGIGTAALGGVGLCFPIIIMILAFANLFGTGGAPLFSIALGAKDEESAERIQNTAFSMLTVASVLLMVLFSATAKPLLYLFGASDASIVYALPYLRIYLIGTFFSMAATGMNPFITAQGFSSVGMVTIMIGAVLNLILDPIFIFAFDLGVRGAAIATVISQAVSALFVLLFLHGKKARFRLHFLKPVEWRKSGTDIRNILSLGTSGFIMQFTNSLVQIACNTMLFRYGGDLYISVMTIVSSVRQLLDVPILAIAEGASPVMSYNYGAGRGENVKKAIRIMSITAISYTAVMWALILWKPGAFISIFSNDKTILVDAIPALHLYFFAFIFQALQYSGQTTFKALGKSKKAIFFSLFRKVIMVVPLTLLLPTVFGMGTDGVFMAEPISNFVGGTACFVTMLLTILPELNKMKSIREKRS